MPIRQQQRGPAALLALLAVNAALQQALAQPPNILWPLQGQGSWDSKILGPCTVHVDVYLERVLSVDQAGQAWRAVHRLHLTWRDKTALAAVQEATTAWFNASRGQTAYDGCRMPCDASLNFEAGCCETLFLPQIDLPNLLSFDYQVNPPRWRIWVERDTLPDGSPTSIVHWTVRLDGTWFSPFDFRAWPLEHQHLLMEMQPAPAIADKVTLALGTVSALTATPHTKGVDIAGWRINKVTQRLYDTSACHRRSNTTTWVYDFDPDTGAAVQHRVNITQLKGLYGNQTKVTRVPESSCSSNNVEGMAQYGPYIIVVDTQIYRTQLYYILIYLVPLIIVDLLVFVVYAMDRQNLEARAGVIVTLVLALSALQFTYDFPPASYINVVQQLSLTSFVLFGLVAICCIVTSSICRIHERKARYEAHLMAAGLRSLRQSMDVASRPSTGIDSELAFELGLDRASSAQNRGSGLFFGSAATTLTEDTWPIRTSNQAARRSQDAACAAPPSGPVALPMPPIAEVESDRHPDFTIPELPAGPGRPVAEGTLWGNMTEWTKTNLAKIKNPLSPRAQAASAASAAVYASQDPESPGTGASPFAANAGPPRITKLTTLQRGRRSVSKFVSNVHATSRNVSNKISADEAYAQLVARRIDIVSSIVLFVCYVAAIATQLTISKDIGDHKLMLAGMSTPGNM